MLCSKVAILFNHILTKLIFLRVKLKNPFISNRWKWCSTVIIFISFVGFPIGFLHLSEKVADDMLFSVEDMDKIPCKFEKKLFYSFIEGWRWSYPHTIFNLITYCILKFFFIILSISCPVPNGIFAPIYSLGGGFGRLYGHILRLIGE